MSFIRKVGHLLDVRAAALAGEDKLAIRNVLEHAGGGLELVEVVVHEGAVALALAQCALHFGSIPLVLHDADGHGAIVQWDEPCTACLICMQHVRSAWLHTCAAWVAHTGSSVEITGVYNGIL